MKCVVAQVGSVLWNMDCNTQQGPTSKEQSRINRDILETPPTT